MTYVNELRLRRCHFLCFFAAVCVAFFFGSGCSSIPHALPLSLYRSLLHKHTEKLDRGDPRESVNTERAQQQHAARQGGGGIGDNGLVFLSDRFQTRACVHNKPSDYYARGRRHEPRLPRDGATLRPVPSLIIVHGASASASGEPVVVFLWSEIPQLLLKSPCLFAA